MSITRADDFREIRRLLGDPKEQRPTPDLIVSNQIAAEQFLLNRMTGTGKGWTQNSTTKATIANQAEYQLTHARDDASIGKILFVYRDLGSNVIIPVPQTDFINEIMGQRYQFWVASVAGQSTARGERVAFFRKDDNTIWMRVYPIPADVATYTIVYATGALDWREMEWTDTPVLPEFSRYRQLLAAFATLAKCEWDGYLREENFAYRRELRADLQQQIAMYEPEVNAFLRNPQHEPSISEAGYFWE